MSFNQLENHINYIDSQPSLVTRNTLSQLHELTHMKTLTFPEKIISILQQYWYVFLICLIIIILLIWRYKKIKKEEKENFFYDDLDNKQMITPTAFPTFNPYLQLNQQNSYVRYLPNEQMSGAINDNIKDINYVNTNNMIGLLDNIDTRYTDFQQPLVDTGPVYHNANVNENISDINLKNNRSLNSKNLDDLNKIHQRF